MSTVNEKRGGTTMNSNSDNSRVGQEFQERVCMIMQQYWGKDFGLEVPISIGAPPKEHRFDCASKDKSIVVECIFLADSLLTDGSRKGLFSVFNKIIGFYICQQIFCKDGLSIRSQYMKLSCPCAIS